MASHRKQQLNVKKKNKQTKQPIAKHTFNLQLNNKFQVLALADAEKQTPPGTCGSRSDRPANGSLEIPGKLSRAGGALKKKVVDTRSDSLNERCRQQNPEAQQTVKRMTLGNLRSETRRLLERGG